MSQREVACAIFYTQQTSGVCGDVIGHVASWLATCAGKPKVPVSSPAASYVQR